MIVACCKQGHDEEALNLYSETDQSGIVLDHFVLASFLPACGNLGAMEEDKEFHKEIGTIGYESNLFVGNALSIMCIKCGNVEDAQKLFDEILEQNVVPWNTMIVGFCTEC